MYFSLSKFDNRSDERNARKRKKKERNKEEGNQSQEEKKKRKEITLNGRIRGAICVQTGRKKAPELRNAPTSLDTIR